MSRFDPNPWLAIFGLACATITTGQAPQRATDGVINPPDVPGESEMVRPAPDVNDERILPPGTPAERVPLQGSKDRLFCSTVSLADAQRRCEAWLATQAKAGEEKASAACKEAEGDAACRFKAVGSIGLAH